MELYKKRVGIIGTIVISVNPALKISIEKCFFGMPGVSERFCTLI